MKSDQGRTYMLALAAAALAGIPVAAAAVLFDSVVHGLTTVFWTDIPKDLLDVGEPPWWYVLLLPTLAGLLTWPVLKLPGKGGHSPADGLSFAPAGPKLAASTILAAFISLVLGIVLGPEAPLVALGLALGTVAGRLATKNQVMASMVALAGGFAAISTVFGGRGGGRGGDTPFTGALHGALLVGSAAAVLAWLIALAASGSVATQPETPSAPPTGAPSVPTSQVAT